MGSFNHTRATCFSVQVGGIGPNPCFIDQMKTVDEIRDTYGHDAANAYADMIACRTILARIRENIRTEDDD